jgi:hypothetical protein
MTGGTTREETRIRPAREEDLPALVRIYNHYVATTHITFDTEPFSEAGRRPWLESFSLDGPHRLFVATLGERLVGYASSSRFRPKPAYARSVEATIYRGSWVEASDARSTPISSLRSRASPPSTGPTPASPCRIRPRWASMSVSASRSSAPFAKSASSSGSTGT